MMFLILGEYTFNLSIATSLYARLGESNLEENQILHNIKYNHNIDYSEEFCVRKYTGEIVFSVEENSKPRKPIDLVFVQDMSGSYGGVNPDTGYPSRPGATGTPGNEFNLKITESVRNFYKGIINYKVDSNSDGINDKLLIEDNDRIMIMGFNGFNKYVEEDNTEYYPENNFNWNDKQDSDGTYTEQNIDDRPGSETVQKLEFASNLRSGTGYIDNINNEMNDRQFSGATPTGTGMEIAKDAYEVDKGDIRNRETLFVLVTDGTPNVGSLDGEFPVENGSLSLDYEDNLSAPAVHLVTSFDNPVTVKKYETGYLTAEYQGIIDKNLKYMEEQANDIKSRGYKMATLYQENYNFMIRGNWGEKYSPYFSETSSYETDLNEMVKHQATETKYEIKPTKPDASLMKYGDSVPDNSINSHYSDGMYNTAKKEGSGNYIFDDNKPSNPNEYVRLKMINTLNKMATSAETQEFRGFGDPVGGRWIDKDGDGNFSNDDYYEGGEYDSVIDKTKYTITSNMNDSELDNNPLERSFIGILKIIEDFTKPNPTEITTLFSTNTFPVIYKAEEIANTSEVNDSTSWTQVSKNDDLGEPIISPEFPVIVTKDPDNPGKYISKINSVGVYKYEYDETESVPSEEPMNLQPDENGEYGNITIVNYDGTSNIAQVPPPTYWETSTTPFIDLGGSIPPTGRVMDCTSFEFEKNVSQVNGEDVTGDKPEVNPGDEVTYELVSKNTSSWSKTLDKAKVIDEFEPKIFLGSSIAVA